MYFVTSVFYNTESDKINAHCWGFFPTREVAEGVVYRDRGDMHDLLYPFLLIEEIEEDLLEPVIKEIAWYAFSADMLEWKLSERPQALEHIAGFSIAR